VDGIHLSSMVGERGAEAVREKLTSFSHTECALPQYLTDENLNSAIQKRIDPCGNNTWMEWQITNNNFPKYLRDNLEKYPYLVTPQFCEVKEQQ